MPFAAPSIGWRAVAPELALSCGAILTLVADAIRPKISRLFLAIVTLVSLGAAGWFTFDLKGVHRVVLQGMVAIDGPTTFARFILLGVSAMTVLVSYHYLSARGIHRGEHYPLLLIATAGMSLFAASNDLIMVFLTIEVLSLPLYVMVGSARRDGGSREGALKYFLLGSFSSAFLLYGVALTYGATGTTNFGSIATRAVAGGVNDRLMLIALALIAVGIAFKVAAVPFHMWTPDVYQGAPTNVTGFMAAGTKAAGFVAMLRLFLVAFGAMQWDWRPVLWIVAVATMVVGSVLAIVQSDVKRMLAYSSIAHAGYVLIGVVAANQSGVTAALFYLAIYAIMVLGAFATVMASGRAGNERLALTQWTGLARRHPLFGAAMTIFLLALAGVPPTAGFAGKFLLFAAAIQAHEGALVVVASTTTVIAAFFYLRLIVLMWLQDEPAGAPGIGRSPSLLAGVGLAALATLAFGVWPQTLIDLARHARIFTG